MNKVIIYTTAAGTLEYDGAEAVHQSGLCGMRVLWHKYATSRTWLAVLYVCSVSVVHGHHAEDATLHLHIIAVI